LQPHSHLCVTVVPILCNRHWCWHCRGPSCGDECGWRWWGDWSDTMHL